ncbi:uncharacterized protein Gasu_49220 [Galdieria sulphuraria]|uniref:Uncharacterized protein n=1 Tax=Galdieria sulphuraria TaxID=130081 RepID=M2VW58_GALSU|nr:uncharacterized protein Gasu_49220 [Galdieria sulphuraria]EME27471.1 hypothetical protein Gasu_49220 [Galdieria sulphuraria]|eukprot:XP_005703991.1 hypothetical protein Gasu_49220 [Galdieria sulphuraria]
MARTHSCHETFRYLSNNHSADITSSLSEDSSRSSNGCFATLVQVCHEEKHFHGQKRVYVRPCESCGIDHEGKYGTGRFCSSACAHKKGGLGRAKQLRAERIKRVMSISEITQSEPQAKQTGEKKIKERKLRWPGKGYKLCNHCRQKVPSRLRRCRQCGKNFQNNRYIPPAVHRSILPTLLPKWSSPAQAMWPAMMVQTSFNPNLS